MRRRQRDFLQQVYTTLGRNDDKLNTFRSVSRAYRSGSISAPEYYQAWLEQLGTSASGLFSQLVDLLPDEQLRVALMAAHNDYRARVRMRHAPSKSALRASLALSSNRPCMEPPRWPVPCHPLAVGRGAAGGERGAALRHADHNLGSAAMGHGGTDRHAQGSRASHQGAAVHGHHKPCTGRRPGRCRDRHAEHDRC